MPHPTARFVALDVHKQYVVVGAIDVTQTLVLPPRRVSMAQFPEWARRHLASTDQVVLETSVNTWDLYDLLVPLVSRVVVADPTQVKVIAASFVKTDKRDTLALAKLLAANLIPEVWVPPPEVRELRALMAHRRRLVVQCTMAKNRLQSLLHRHNLPAPGASIRLGRNIGLVGGAESLPLLSACGCNRIWAVIATLGSLIETVERELAQLSQQDPWSEHVPFLIQLPGIGLVGAMTILAAIGDITRFQTAKHLVGYAGLGTRIHASGPGASLRRHYQTRANGPAHDHGGSRLGCRPLSAVWRARFEQLTHGCLPRKPLWLSRASFWS